MDKNITLLYRTCITTLSLEIPHFDKLVLYHLGYKQWVKDFSTNVIKNVFLVAHVKFIRNTIKTILGFPDEI